MSNKDTLNLFTAMNVELPEEISKEVSGGCQAGAEVSNENPGDANPVPCSTSPKKGKKAAVASNYVPPAPKEPEKDLPRFVVMTNDNFRQEFPAEMSLEEIRLELEREYPALTAENTSWYFEKQEGPGRYLCVPTYKSNKAG